jgi:hypothetical protein
VNLRSVWTVAAKDLRRRRRDPLGLLVALAIPAGLLVVFLLAFGGIDSGKLPRAKLLVVDQDGGVLSRLVTGAFGQGQLANLVEAVPVDSSRALREIRRGRASGALFIPKGFTRDYLRGRPVELRLLKNPSQRILPTILEEILATLSDGGTALRDLLGGPLGRILEETDSLSAPPSEELVSGVSLDVRRTMSKAGGYLLPPAISVKTEEADGAGEEPGFLLLFFPGLAGLTLLYLGQVVALDFSVERRQGTIRRGMAAGIGTRELFTGKILAGMLIILPLLFVVFSLGSVLLALPAVRLLGGWALASAAAFAIVGAICRLALIPKNPSQANVVTNIAILPISFLGGCYFPIEALSDSLHALAARLPMGWIIERIKDVVLERPHPAGQPWSAAGICLLVGAVLLALSGRLARRRFHEA